MYILLQLRARTCHTLSAQKSCRVCDCVVKQGSSSNTSGRRAKHLSCCLQWGEVLATYFFFHFMLLKLHFLGTSALAPRNALHALQQNRLWIGIYIYQQMPYLCVSLWRTVWGRKGKQKDILPLKVNFKMEMGAKLFRQQLCPNRKSLSWHLRF